MPLSSICVHVSTYCKGEEIISAPPVLTGRLQRCDNDSGSSRGFLEEDTQQTQHCLYLDNEEVKLF